MLKHINKHHPEIIIKKALSKNQEAINRQLRLLYRQAKVNGDAKEFDFEILEAFLNIIVLTKALISLIVVRNLSFIMIKWPEFYTLCQVLNRACKGKITTSYSGVYNKVKEAWEKHKDIV
jgi:hypothetical protein